MFISVYAIIMMFIMTAIVEYVPPIFFSNFLAPICRTHIENSMANVNVNKTDDNPVANPDSNTSVQNIIPVFRGDDMTQFDNFLYHA